MKSTKNLGKNSQAMKMRLKKIQESIQKFEHNGKSKKSSFEKAVEKLSFKEWKKNSWNSKKFRKNLLKNDREKIQ